MSEKSITVHLIEYNAGDARVIQELLREQNSTRFEPSHVRTLATGLKRLAAGGIDVVLLDLSLPDSNGIATFNQVHEHLPKVPIVVLTGLDDATVESEILHAGGHDFLTKGLLNFCAVHKSIQHAMERTQGENSHDARHAVEAVDRIHDEFLAVLCDELNMPLMSVWPNISALSDELAKGADLSSSLAVIRQQLDRQMRLIDDVRTYSRVGTQGTTFQPTDFAAVLGRALANLKPLIDESGAVITHDRLPNLWADGNQIEWLFQKLIGNAIEDRGKAYPRIHVTAERQGPESVFSVRDNGIGFDSKLAERIFTVNQQLSDRDRYPGTGIGLAICKKIVERHAGRIWAESEPGWGSRFFFTILTTEGNQ